MYYSYVEIDYVATGFSPARMDLAGKLLIITRRTLDKHLQKMETVLTRLRDAGLQVNAAKSLFCAHEIEYLGYILTREGIKSQPQKKCKQYLR